MNDKNEKKVDQNTDILELEKINNKTKIWILALLNSLIKHGKLLNASILLNKLLIEIRYKFNNLDFFFEKIEQNLSLPLTLYIRRVAGKKMMIPNFVKKDKEILYIVKLIFKNINMRLEKKKYDRILNELIDIFNNKGNTIKKRQEICNDIKASIPNLRFLK